MSGPVTRTTSNKWSRKPPSRPTSWLCVQGVAVVGPVVLADHPGLDVEQVGIAEESSATVEDGTVHQRPGPAGVELPDQPEPGLLRASGCGRPRGRPRRGPAGRPSSPADRRCTPASAATLVSSAAAIMSRATTASRTSGAYRIASNVAAQDGRARDASHHDDLVGSKDVADQVVAGQRAGSGAAARTRAGRASGVRPSRRRPSKNAAPCMRQAAQPVTAPPVSRIDCSRIRCSGTVGVDVGGDEQSAARRTPSRAPGLATGRAVATGRRRRGPGGRSRSALRRPGPIGVVRETSPQGCLTTASVGRRPQPNPSAPDSP